MLGLLKQIHPFHPAHVFIMMDHDHDDPSIPTSFSKADFVSRGSPHDIFPNAFLAADLPLRANYEPL